MDKINVNLYGGKGLFGGRESPLEADEIYCDKYKNCSFYKEGKCLRIRNFLAPTCKFGRNNVTKGYTSRAAKYHTFKKKYELDEVYHKLNYPNDLVALIDNYLYIYTNYVDVRERNDRDEVWKKDINDYIIEDCGFGANYCFIPINKITNELLFKIFEYTPHSLFNNNIIKEWKDKRVPEILQNMKKVVPNIYDRFVEEYPQYKFEPNYIGKTAYVYSLKPGTIFTKEVEWLFDGEYIISQEPFNLSSRSPFFFQDSSITIDPIRLKVNEKMTFKVTDNSIIDEDTKFE